MNEITTTLSALLPHIPLDNSYRTSNGPANAEKFIANNAKQAEKKMVETYGHDWAATKKLGEGILIADLLGKGFTFYRPDQRSANGTLQIKVKKDMKHHGVRYCTIGWKRSKYFSTM